MSGASAWSTRNLEIISEPKARQSQSGKLVCGFSAGIVGDNKQVFDCVAFGPQAELIANTYRAGSTFIARGYQGNNGGWVVNEVLIRAGTSKVSKEGDVRGTPTEPTDPYEGWQTNPIIFCQKWLGDSEVYQRVIAVVPRLSDLFLTDKQMEIKRMAKGQGKEDMLRVGETLNKEVLARYGTEKKELLKEAMAKYRASLIKPEPEVAPDQPMPEELWRDHWQEELDQI